MSLLICATSFCCLFGVFFYRSTVAGMPNSIIVPPLVQYFPLVRAEVSRVVTGEDLRFI